MIDQSFCDFLEIEISKALAISADETTKGFWCDGVILPTFEKHYSQKHVNDYRKIRMIVFTGTTGQDQYELTLKFGNKALSRYARGLAIKECLPKENWLYVDILKHEMIALLD